MAGLILDHKDPDAVFRLSEVRVGATAPVVRPSEEASTKTGISAELRSAGQVGHLPLRKPWLDNHWIWMTLSPAVGFNFIYAGYDFAGEIVERFAG